MAIEQIIALVAESSQSGHTWLTLFMLGWGWGRGLIRGYMVNPFNAEQGRGGGCNQVIHWLTVIMLISWGG